MASPTEEQKRKILIAVDMSTWAEEAFKWYVSHAHHSNSEVICFHSVEPPWISAAESYGLAAEAYGDALEGCKKTAKKVEEKYVVQMREASVPGRVVVKFGQNPGESIVDMAKEEQVAMVVLGCRGLGKIRRTILGSVSDYVLHHVHCPVAVCRHPEPHDGASA